MIYIFCKEPYNATKKELKNIHDSLILLTSIYVKNSNLSLNQCVQPGEGASGTVQNKTNFQIFFKNFLCENNLIYEKSSKGIETFYSFFYIYSTSVVFGSHF